MTSFMEFMTCVCQILARFFILAMNNEEDFRKGILLQNAFQTICVVISSSFAFHTVSICHTLLNLVTLD